MLIGVFRIKNQLGIHARPAAKLAQVAQQFGSQIHILKSDKDADAKSILDLLSLGCGFNDEIKLVVKGLDEELAFNAVSEFIQQELGERVNGKGF